MKNIKFEVISEMCGMVFGTRVRMESIRYNIGLNSNRFHHSLYVLNYSGEPVGAEIHEEFDGNKMFFNDTINLTTRREISDEGMKLLLETLKVFIGRQDLHFEEGKPVNRNVIVERSIDTEVLDRKVRLEQIEVSFGRSRVKTHVLTGFRKATTTYSGNEDTISFEIHGKECIRDMLLYTENTHREIIHSEELSLLREVLNMFVNSKESITYAELGHVPNSFIKERGYW